MVPDSLVGPTASASKTHPSRADAINALRSRKIKLSADPGRGTLSERLKARKEQVMSAMSQKHH
jgi:hypothetical protein